MARAKNHKGEIACSGCDGEGIVDVVYGHPNDTNAPGGRARCHHCNGSGAEDCCNCGEPAKIEGRDPDYLYCGTECAESDGNAPVRATEITCLPDALLAGDELLGSGIGGHAGTIQSVRTYSDAVRVDFADGRTAALGLLEVCQVRRPTRSPEEDVRAQVAGA